MRDRHCQTLAPISFICMVIFKLFPSESVLVRLLYSLWANLLQALQIHVTIIFIFLYWHNFSGPVDLGYFDRYYVSLLKYLLYCCIQLIPVSRYVLLKLFFLLSIFFLFLSFHHSNVNREQMSGKFQHIFYHPQTVSSPGFKIFRFLLSFNFPLFTRILNYCGYFIHK